MSITPLSEKSGDNLTREPCSVNQVPQSGKRHLVKAAAVVGLMTLLSRFLGLTRDIVSAKSFGTSWQWDAFLYAFMFPNLFRRIVGEGGLTSAFIPVYNDISEKQGKNEALRFTNITISFLACALLVFILLVEGILTLLMRIPNLSATVSLTLSLMRVTFPYLWFVAFYALGMGVLNSHRHFLSPALAPIILDIIWITAVFLAPIMTGPDYVPQVHFLCYALLLSGVLYIACQWIPLKRIGFKLQWIWDVGYPGLQRVWKLLLPVIMTFAVVQINITVDMTLGMMIGPGANSSLWYGNRLMQFPLGVFAIAMGTALLPMLAQQVAGGQKEASRKTLSFALRSTFFIIIPSSVGLIVLAKPIIQMLFERGEFDAVSTTRSAAVLIGYSIGLFAYAGQKIIASGFYAAHDSKTPMRTSVVALISNLGFNLILMIPFKEAGLALGTSISGIIQLIQLIYFYPKKVDEFPFREVLKSFLRILAASLAMAVVCYFSWELLRGFLNGASTKIRLIQVLGSIAIAALSYLGLCLICRVPEAQEALNWIKNRKMNARKA